MNNLGTTKLETFDVAPSQVLVLENFEAKNVDAELDSQTDVTKSAPHPSMVGHAAYSGVQDLSPGEFAAELSKLPKLEQTKPVFVGVHGLCLLIRAIVDGHVTCAPGNCAKGKLYAYRFRFNKTDDDSFDIIISTGFMAGVSKVSANVNSDELLSKLADVGALLPDYKKAKVNLLGGSDTQLKVNLRLGPNMPITQLLKLCEDPVTNADKIEPITYNRMLTYVYHLLQVLAARAHNATGVWSGVAVEQFLRTRKNPIRFLKTSHANGQLLVKLGSIDMGGGSCTSTGFLVSRPGEKPSYLTGKQLAHLLSEGGALTSNYEIAEPGVVGKEPHNFKQSSLACLGRPHIRIGYCHFQTSRMESPAIGNELLLFSLVKDPSTIDDAKEFSLGGGTGRLDLQKISNQIEGDPDMDVLLGWSDGRADSLGGSTPHAIRQDPFVRPHTPTPRGNGSVKSPHGARQNKSKKRPKKSKKKQRSDESSDDDDLERSRTKSKKKRRRNEVSSSESSDELSA